MGGATKHLPGCEITAIINSVTETPPDTKVCHGCQSSNKSSQFFCVKCGKNLDPSFRKNRIPEVTPEWLKSIGFLNKTVGENDEIDIWTFTSPSSKSCGYDCTIQVTFDQGNAAFPGSWKVGYDDGYGGWANIPQMKTQTQVLNLMNALDIPKLEKKAKNVKT